MGKSERIWEKVVLFGKKFFVFGERCCNRLKVFLIGEKLYDSVKSGSILEKLLYLGKVVVFGRNWL